MGKVNQQLRHQGRAKEGDGRANAGQRRHPEQEPASYGVAVSEECVPKGAWGESLRWWREEGRKWSRKEFCEQVEAMAYRMKEAQGTKLDEKMVWRWESGQVKRPRSFYLRILAEMGAPLPLTTRSAIVLPPESPETAVARAACTEDDEDMDRRGFLRGTGAAALTAVACCSAAAIPVKVDSAHIRDLHRSVDDLYTKDQHIGGAVLAGAALHQYHWVRYMLDEATMVSQLVGSS